MIGLVALALTLQVGAAPLQSATVTARVTPESPSVGEAITVELRVRAPAGSTIRFPVLPDTGTRIEPLDPRTLRDESTARGVDRRAIYRLIAWDTGAVALSFGDVTVEREGAAQRYPVVIPSLVVRSLLPADTSKRAPRAARDLVDADTTRWRLWLALAVIAALVFTGWRRRQRARRERLRQPPDAFVRAREAFAHAKALGLSAAGEPGRHALMHVAALRRYMAERWPVAGADLTASELSSRLEHADFPILPERVVTLVARAEAIAYARAPIAAAEADRIAADAWRVIEDLERVWESRRAQEAQNSAPIKRKRL